MKGTATSPMALNILIHSKGGVEMASVTKINVWDQKKAKSRSVQVRAETNNKISTSTQTSRVPKISFETRSNIFSCVTENGFHLCTTLGSNLEFTFTVFTLLIHNVLIHLTKPSPLLGKTRKATLGSAHKGSFY